MAVEFPALTLPRYAARIGYTECAFYGIHHPDNPTYACREMWTQDQRDEIWHQLLLAQGMIEEVIGYPLAARWITEDRQRYRRLIQARWANVIEAGVMSDVMVEEGAAVDHTGDPATVGPVAVGDYKADDLHLFYAGLDVEVPYSDVTIAAGNATFEVPRCRLVDPDYWVNPVTGWDYADVATWGAATVDVRAIVNDPSTNAVLRGPSWCDDCEDETDTGCIRIRDDRLGLLVVTPANWDDDDEEWNSCALDCGCWDFVDLYYRAGAAQVSRIAEDTVMRLAHANMPTEPCGCDVTQRLWARDRTVPNVLTRDRLNCPFGISDGAWMAWRFATRQRIVKGGVLA
jgi:hypothetical protein